MNSACPSSTPEERKRLKQRLHTLDSEIVEKKIGEVCEIAKALSDPQRLKLLLAIGNREVCGCDLVALLDLSQPAISYHLNILAKVGLLKKQRQGRFNRFQYNPNGIAQLIPLFQELIKE